MSRNIDFTIPRELFWLHLLTCFLFLQLVPSVSLPEKRKTAKQVKEERHTVTQELKN